MKKIRELDKNLLTAISVFSISVIGFLASSFLVLGEYRNIPLGFLFSGAVIGGLYLLTFFLGKKDIENGSSTLSIISIIIRLFLIIGILILLGFMNYRWSVNLFNLFVFIGIYSFGVITFVLSHLLNK